VASSTQPGATPAPLGQWRTRGQAAEMKWQMGQALPGRIIDDDASLCRSLARL